MKGKTLLYDRSLCEAEQQELLYVIYVSHGAGFGLWDGFESLEDAKLECAKLSKQGCPTYIKVEAVELAVI
jgi:hypothetical protein